mgnify:CR=1 FL=1
MGLEDLVATGEASGIGSMVAGAEALVAVGEAPSLGEVVVEVGIQLRHQIDRRSLGLERAKKAMGFGRNPMPRTVVC